MPVANLCRKAGISAATYFYWKKKYDGLLLTEMVAWQLEDENSRVAEGGCRSEPPQGDAPGFIRRKL